MQDIKCNTVADNDFSVGTNNCNGLGRKNCSLRRRILAKVNSEKSICNCLVTYLRLFIWEPSLRLPWEKVVRVCFFYLALLQNKAVVTS